MGKYYYFAFVGIVAVVVLVLVFHWLNRRSDELADVTNRNNQEASSGTLVDPEILVVTLDDSLYHEPDCAWIGRESRRIPRKIAVDRGFRPCPQCINDE